ncbi:NfeD family protein [Streptomyces griseoviridis]|jgi:membrane protein implicated in regulation of membrane protease activity|uniref:Membrane protein n=3 Tax=Streptomyces TaxID=1883 RepID=A0A918GGP4_STRGD|nr:MULTISPECIES: NfeD family protein [Streptomyces]MDP9683076.1 membrane protein implicated in regulation of membrane protease activity [Streptomyces griseoviridis]GGS36587.1 membrane protein [Streptomyces niveoruber]GGS89483.1 membrane protein [Streptomyces griseoviridis]GGU61354.1 membrane protein [Streptomyces daghestanicus]GHI32711.1 membrane protein [Streptomyces daghestanicus]
MEPWLVWLIVAAVLAVLEICTLTVVFGLLGVAAAFTAGFAAAGLALPFQFVAYAVLAVASVLFVRPVALRHLRPSHTARFGTDALVGRAARTVTEVTGTDGRVRIDGEEWTARCYDETLAVPAGATVDVIEIRGATALVYPRD